MSEHNDPRSRQEKRKALGVLFSVCGRGAEAAPAIDVYLQSARRIPADVYQEAVQILIDSWTYPNPPQPGDIGKMVQKVVGQRRVNRRQRRDLEYRQKLEREAMTPGEARALLQETVEAPEPAHPWERLARKLSVWLLRKRAGTGVQEIPERTGE